MHPNYNNNIKTTTKSAYDSLKNIARLKGFLTKQDSEIGAQVVYWITGLL